MITVLIIRLLLNKLKLNQQIALVMFMVFFMVSPHQIHAQISKSKAQAVYMYAFTKYIDFNKPNYTIGVWNSEDAKAAIQASMKQDAPIKVMHISSAGQVSACDMIFIPESESAALASVISAAGGKRILTIAEGDLASAGAPVSFVFVDSKMRFKFNIDAFNRTGLKPDKQLVELALIH
jgi:hypothetical protein